MENINRQAILKSEIDNLTREIRNFNITAEQKEIVKNTIRKIEEKLSQAKYIFPYSFKWINLKTRTCRPIITRRIISSIIIRL
jgi:hypothetical protein